MDVHDKRASTNVSPRACALSDTCKWHDERIDSEVSLFTDDMKLMRGIHTDEDQEGLQMEVDSKPGCKPGTINLMKKAVWT